MILYGRAAIMLQVRIGTVSYRICTIGKQARASRERHGNRASTLTDYRTGMRASPAEATPVQGFCLFNPCSALQSWDEAWFHCYEHAKRAHHAPYTLPC